MNISLTPTLEDFIKQKVSSGLYHSSSEVVREGLRLLEEKEKLKQIKLQELKKDIQAGLDSLAQGKGIPAEQVFSRLKKKYETS